MCDFCGCRRSGPTSELAAEHERLLELGDVLHTALHDGTDASVVFDEFVRLLQMHAAKEEVGLFVHARSSTPLGDQSMRCAASTTTSTGGWPMVPRVLTFRRRFGCSPLTSTTRSTTCSHTSSTLSIPSNGTRSSSPTAPSKRSGTNPSSARRHGDPLQPFPTDVMMRPI